MTSRTARRGTMPRALSVGLTVLLTLGLFVFQHPAAAMQARGGAVAGTLDWPYYGNDLGGMRYQNVDQISPSNVAALKPAWVFHTGVMNSSRLSFETQPIVVGGTMYVTSGEDHVFALDPTTGALKWTYNPTLPALSKLALCCGEDNRGVAVGGGRVFIGQLDGNLAALDAATGKRLWQTQVVSYKQRYTITMAPQYVAGKVIVGVSGAEFNVRGSLSAYDAATGQLVWRFYTTPGPGQFGHNTWAGNSWLTGGASVWMTPTVDTSLGLMYFATGNPGSDLNGSQRAGLNLFSDSIVALDYRTGQLRWYYQEIHHDLWDYDGPQMTQLYTVTHNGQRIPAIGHANKNGNYFILDRHTGAPIFPVREMPVPTTPSWQHAWPTQPMPTNDALEPQTVTTPVSGMTSGPLFTVPQSTPTLIQPGFETGPQWPAGAFSPRTGYVYLPSGGYAPWAYHATQQEINTEGSTGEPSMKVATYGLFDAVNTSTGKIAWRIKTSYRALSGMVAAGDLVFYGESIGRFNAVDARTGQRLWSYTADMPDMGGANGSPAVYVSGGREYVAMAFGGNREVRGNYGTATSQLGDALVAFALPAAGQSSTPNVVTANPTLAKTGTPATFPALMSAPPGARVVTIDEHDYHFYPSQFTARAGEKIAVHLKNTGKVGSIGFAVDLPTGPIGLEGNVGAGQDEYFAFTAPLQPGGYQFYGPGDAQFYGATGVLTVIP